MLGKIEIQIKTNLSGTKSIGEVQFSLVKMEKIEFWLARIEHWVWGAPLLILLSAVGLYLTFALRGIQFRYLFYALRLAFTRQDDKAAGDISQFQALMTALAGMIGIGSITGVATAISMGGLGSLFWMWVASLTSYAMSYGLLGASRRGAPRSPKLLRVRATPLRAPGRRAGRSST